MARMYSGKRGKSGSTKPASRRHPSWVRHRPKEIELLIVKLAKEGKTPSQIGLYLRDSYGVPNVRGITKKKICQILKEKKLLSKLPEDITALIKRSIILRKHLEKNHKDIPAKRGLELTESKIKRLAKYHKRTGKIAATWKYDPKTVSMYLE